MNRYILACAAALLVASASASHAQYRTTLVHGHPLHHENTRTAGVAMGLSISVGREHATHLTGACRELQRVVQLPGERTGHLRLEALFVVPYKAMAIEGLYLPAAGSSATPALVAGKRPARPNLDRIIASVGIPPRVLDEIGVEHEISCRFDEPLWTITWQDLRSIGDQTPAAVIERARSRFIDVFRTVGEFAAGVRRSPAGL